MGFGFLLKQVMKKHGITGKNLSIFSNLTEGFISDIKNEKTLPKEENLNKILNSMRILESEKISLRVAWEKDVSPRSFVKRYEELENDYEILSSFYTMGDLDKGAKLKELILETTKKNQALELEVKFLKLYKDFFEILYYDMSLLNNKTSFKNQKKIIDSLKKYKYVR